MGRREFYAWVDQAHRDNQASEPQTDRWNEQASDSDWWAQARERRKKMQGRA